MKKRMLQVNLILCLALLISACGMLPSIPASDQGEIGTLSAQLIQQGRETIAAQETLTSEVGQDSTKGLPPIWTSTFAPANTILTATPTFMQSGITLAPSSTLRPSSTPLPSFTPVPPQPTAVPVPCDRGGFVADVSIPDGTILSPGQSFVKTWRIRNSGTCTWGSGYGLVFSSGDQLGGTSPTPLGQTVSPGDVVEVSVTLHAPSSAGKYRSSWRLQNAAGNTFGFGTSNGSIYADIEVKGVSSNPNYAYDFVANYCKATWSNGTDTLACPGTVGDSKGYVQAQAEMVLETGTRDDESGLVTVPEAKDNGYISGTYPAYTVKAGDTFNALIMCARNAENCNVDFKLQYVKSDGGIETIAIWDQVYDGQYQAVTVDLDNYITVGESVRFILRVEAAGSFNQDYAQWLAPRILKAP